MKLITTNPEQLEFNSKELKVYLLGGIQLKGLDRMRVTIKLEANHKTIRHNLDLYNDSQVERLVRRTSEKLELHTLTIEEHIDKLINAVEEYRVSQLSEPKLTTKELTPEERKEAINYLKGKNLLQRTSQDIGRAGIVGEELNCIIMYLIFISRKMKNPLHVVSLGASGVGKTHLQSKVGELVPDEDKLEITFLSENSFYYFGKEELKHKLILIEDLDGAEGVLYPLRELQTKKRITKTIVTKKSNGETRTEQLVVEGPVSVGGCTTRETIYEDNANRSFLLYIDDSSTQDERIMQYQRKLSSGTINVQEELKTKELLQNTQRVLQPIAVRNPFAEHLVIPQQIFKPRRTNAHYLAFIEAVTFYHQYQRKQQKDKVTGEAYIKTTKEDIQEANKLLQEVLIRKSDELSGACRKYLEQVKSYLKSSKQSSYTNAELRNELRINPNNQKYYTTQLITYNYLAKTGKKERGYKYSLVDESEYETLKNNIKSSLNQVLASIK